MPSSISAITREDMDYMWQRLSDSEKEKFSGSRILLTGFAGSIGYTLMHFFAQYGEALQLQKVYAIDNYQFGKPDWLDPFQQDKRFAIKCANVVDGDISVALDADYVLHMASLASPVYYRQYPLETIDADVFGLRRLLEAYRTKALKGFLFFSSSEVYGDPPAEAIPTKESYWGNVNPIGPRACYDESKRLGETLCYNYAQQYQLPITIVRPFNNYGPGMRLNDQRVTADFAQAILQHNNIQIYSDGTPTRTYDYLPDAAVGYLKCLLWGQYDVFNIGSDQPEITVTQLAQIFAQAAEEIAGYSPQITYAQHVDQDYLTDNPSRRCPDISKARHLLGFDPQIDVHQGVRRYLRHILARQ